MGPTRRCRSTYSRQREPEPEPATGEPEPSERQRRARGIAGDDRGSSRSSRDDNVPPQMYDEGGLSYGPPWAHYLGGYQDRLLGGPLGLPDLRCTVPDGVKHKDYRGEVLG
jgi:hypothetical protein